MSDTRLARAEGLQAIAPHRETIAFKVMMALKGRTLTAEEVAAAAGIDLNNARSRLTELKGSGKVETRGRVESPRTGIKISLWTIVDEKE